MIAFAVATVAGLSTFDAGVFLADRPDFWLLVGVGIGAAALAASLRMVAFPIEEVVAFEKDAAAAPSRWMRPLELVLVRTLGDGGWLMLTVLLGMAVRSAVIVAGSGWSAEVIRSLLIAPLAAFIVFLSLLIAGWLLVLAVGGIVRLARVRARGDRVPAYAWWSVAVVACLALAVPATLAVGLSDTTSVALDDGDAIGVFLFGDVRLTHPWQYAALWVARLGTYTTAVSLVGVIVARWSARRRA